MTDQVFDATTHRAAGVSRRGSLMTLGGAGLAALAGPSIVESKKPGKKARKRARKKGKKKCGKQDAQCVQVFADLCAEEEDPEFCEALFTPCCAFFARCQATSFFECAFANAA